MRVFEPVVNRTPTGLRVTGGLREGLVRGAALEVAVLAGAALVAVLEPGSFALASALAVLGTPVAGWLVLS